MCPIQSSSIEICVAASAFEHFFVLLRHELRLTGFAIVEGFALSGGLCPGCLPIIDKAGAYAPRACFLAINLHLVNVTVHAYQDSWSHASMHKCIHAYIHTYWRKMHLTPITLSSDHTVMCVFLCCVSTVPPNGTVPVPYPVL